MIIATVAQQIGWRGLSLPVPARSHLLKHYHLGLILRSQLVAEKKTSAAWKYFNEVQGKPHCNVENCCDILPGKETSNLETHLRIHHVEQFKEVKYEMEKSATANRVKTTSTASTSDGTGTSTKHKQLSLKESCQKKYETNDLKQKKKLRALALFMGTSRYPEALVTQNNEFKSFCEALDFKFSLLTRKVLMDEITSLLTDVKKAIMNEIKGARYLNLTADLWTQKGLSNSFLGVTAHGFNRQTHQRFTVVLACRKVEHPHTGERIKELVKEIIREFEINEAHVLRIMTDNGSNIIKAFKIICQSQQEVPPSCPCENVATSTSVTTLDDECEHDEGENYDECVEFPENIDTIIDSEMNEFEQMELDVEMSFQTDQNMKRSACYAHTLQLVVSKLLKIASVRDVVKRAGRLIEKFCKSYKATELIIAIAGKKLQLDCPTRWSSTYIMTESLLSLKVAVSQVCEDMGWDNLSNTDWKSLQLIDKLLKPFAEHTKLCEGEQATTISLVLPSLLELSEHLKSMSQEGCLKKSCDLLIKELNARFTYVTNPNDTGFDSLFISATLLDPAYAMCLSKEQTDRAKYFIFELLLPTLLPLPIPTNLTEASAGSASAPADTQENVSDSDYSRFSKRPKFANVSKLMMSKILPASSAMHLHTRDAEVAAARDRFSRVQLVIDFHEKSNTTFRTAKFSWQKQQLQLNNKTRSWNRILILLLIGIIKRTV